MIIKLCKNSRLNLSNNLQSEKWLEGVYEDSHENESIDDWILDDGLCEELFPINKVSIINMFIM